MPILSGSLGIIMILFGSIAFRISISELISLRNKKKTASTDGILSKEMVDDAYDIVIKDETKRVILFTLIFFVGIMLLIYSFLVLFNKN